MNKSKSEAGIILGGGVSPEGVLNPVVEKRLDKGIELYQQGDIENFVATGGYGFRAEKPPISEAEAMKRYAAGQGIPLNSILLEDESMDTIGNAVLTKRKILANNQKDWPVNTNNWEHLSVITSPSHLPRSLYIFKHVFGNDFEIKGSTYDGNPAIKDKAYELAGNAMSREVLYGAKPGDHEAIWSRLLELVPGYGSGTMKNLALLSLKHYLRNLKNR